MSTAVLISGQLREFARCYPTQRWQVYRRHEPCEFFILVQRQPDADAILAPLRADYPGRVHVRMIDDPDLPISPAVSKGWHQAPFANAAPAKNLLLQHWYQEQVWKFYVETGGFKHEWIMRQRADNFFHEYEWNGMKSLKMRVDMITNSGHIIPDVQTPWWGTFGGLNDRFAIIPPEVAPHYFGVYSKLEKLLDAGCPFHPESLVKASVEDGGFIVNPSLHALFSTARPKGHPQHPQRWPEILPWEKRPAA